LELIVIFNLTLPQLLAQGVAIIIIIILAICGQQKKQTNFLFYQVITNALYTLQYALLSATTAVWICIICVLRTLIFYLYKKNNKQVPLWLFILILAAAIGSGLYTWENWLSVIPVIATIAYTYGQYHESLSITRKTTIFGDCLWIVYNLFCFAWVDIITKIVTIISIAIVMVREKKNVGNLKSEK
jgi:hypothetical protein